MPLQMFQQKQKFQQILLLSNFNKSWASSLEVFISLNVDVYLKTILY